MRTQTRIQLPIELQLEFFQLLKTKPFFESWIKLQKQLRLSLTPFKQMRNGKRTIPASVFKFLVTQLEEPGQKRFLDAAVLLPANWWCVRAGYNAIRVMKSRMGEEGFQAQLAKTRSCIKNHSAMLDWHRRQREENTVEYQKFQMLQRERFIHRLKNESKETKEKRRRTMLDRYGPDYYLKRGLDFAENQALFPREKSVLEKTKLGNGTTVQSHVSFSSFNIDFVYSRNGKVAAVEEVLGFKKRKAALFFELLLIHEKFIALRQQYPVPFLVSSWFEEKRQGRKHRFSPDFALWCFEKGMIPIFVDILIFQKVKEKVLNGSLSQEDLDGLKFFLENVLDKKKTRLKKGAESQFKQKFDFTEQKVHALLESANCLPQGKKLIPTRFGSFVVTDNFFVQNKKSFAVFVGKTDPTGLVGSAAMVKELAIVPVQTMGINESVGQSTFRPVLRKLLAKYIDKYYPSMNFIQQLEI